MKKIDNKFIIQLYSFMKDFQSKVTKGIGINCSVSIGFNEQGELCFRIFINIHGKNYCITNNIYRADIMRDNHEYILDAMIECFIEKAIHDLSNEIKKEYLNIKKEKNEKKEY